MQSPKAWTFKDKALAKEFDSHVREQLPWYDLVSFLVADIVSCYLPNKGTLIDIGASTGNMSNLLQEQIKEKIITVHNIEPAKEMMDNWRGIGTVHHESAERFNYHYYKANVYIMFLTLMFVKPEYRHMLITKISESALDGAAFVIIDKTCLHHGQVASKVAHLASKKRLNVTGEDYIDKELSLRGIQIPTNKTLLKETLEHYKWNVEQIFQFGEFYGLLAIKETI